MGPRHASKENTAATLAALYVRHRAKAAFKPNATPVGPSLACPEMFAATRVVESAQRLATAVQIENVRRGPRRTRSILMGSAS